MKNLNSKRKVNEVVIQREKSMGKKMVQKFQNPEL